MLTSHLGETKPASGSDGYILIRDLLVMFIVIICFAAILVSFALVSRHSSQLLENVQVEINLRNHSIQQRVNR